MNIRWEKEGGHLPPERSVDDSSGLLVIRDVKVSDSGIYVCQVSDGINIGYKRVTLTVGGTVQTFDTIDFNCIKLDIISSHLTINFEKRIRE